MATAAIRKIQAGGPGAAEKDQVHESILRLFGWLERNGIAATILSMGSTQSLCVRSLSATHSSVLRCSRGCAAFR